MHRFLSGVNKGRTDLSLATLSTLCGDPSVGSSKLLGLFSEIAMYISRVINLFLEEEYFLKYLSLLHEIQLVGS